MTTKPARSSVLKERVFQWWDYPLFLFLTALGLAAIFYFFLHWFSFEDWLYYPLSFSLMTVILLIILVNNQGRWFLLVAMKRPQPMPCRPGWKVGVVTTFVADGEPLEMLEDTLKAMVALDYPHDTWVLDEEDDDRVRALCERVGANHFSRKNLPHYQAERGTFQSRSKHGNYNAWLYEIGFNRYEIITAFDPDHVAQPSYLSRGLGYFDDPKIGYVQAPQAFYNQAASFIARGAAEETYAYHSLIQMAAYGMGYPIIIGGHNTHRVAALKEVGGFAPHDADDLLITLLYRTAGWEGVYVPEILARGLSPVDWTGYLAQQRRWARSVLDLKFRYFPKLSSRLPLMSRIMGLLHGLNYLHRSLVIFPALALVAVMLATGITPEVISFSTVPQLALLCAALQLCEFYRQRFYLDWRHEWGLHWRVVLLHFAKWPHMLLALYDVLSARRVPYVLTAKAKSRGRNFALLWPHALVFILLGGSWLIGKISGQVVHPLVQLGAALLGLFSAALILSELRDVSPPYDKGLRQAAGRPPRP